MASMSIRSSGLSFAGVSTGRGGASVEARPAPVGQAIIINDWGQDESSTLTRRGMCSRG